MEIFIQEDPTFLTIKKWQDTYPNILAGFTTRQGGTFKTALKIKEEKDAVSNRRVLSEKLGVPLTNWVYGEQTHETNIKLIRIHEKKQDFIPTFSELKRTDGFITKNTGILCTAYFADCVPLYFFDPITKSIGIAHAGWKGTVHKIAGKMVGTLKRIGVDPNHLLVVIGPSISQEKYTVDKNVIRYIDEKYKTSTVYKTGKNQYLLNLKQLNVEILLQSGVLRHNIDVTNYCTFTDQNLFYSYRRDAGQTGRMLGYIGLM